MADYCTQQYCHVEFPFKLFDKKETSWKLSTCNNNTTTSLNPRNLYQILHNQSTCFCTNVGLNIIVIFLFLSLNDTVELLESLLTGPSSDGFCCSLLLDRAVGRSENLAGKPNFLYSFGL